MNFTGMSRKSYRFSLKKREIFEQTNKNASIQMLKNLHRGRQLPKLRNPKLINKHKTSFNLNVAQWIARWNSNPEVVCSNTAYDAKF